MKKRKAKRQSIDWRFVFATILYEFLIISEMIYS